MWHSTLRAKSCRRSSLLYGYTRAVRDCCDDPQARRAAFDRAQQLLLAQQQGTQQGHPFAGGSSGSPSCGVASEGAGGGGGLPGQLGQQPPRPASDRTHYLADELALPSPWGTANALEVFNARLYTTATGPNSSPGALRAAELRVASSSGADGWTREFSPAQIARVGPGLGVPLNLAGGPSPAGKFGAGGGVAGLGGSVLGGLDTLTMPPPGLQGRSGSMISYSPNPAAQQQQQLFRAVSLTPARGTSQTSDHLTNATASASNPTAALAPAELTVGASTLSSNTSSVCVTRLAQLVLTTEMPAGHQQQHHPQHAHGRHSSQHVQLLTASGSSFSGTGVRALNMSSGCGAGPTSTTELLRTLAMPGTAEGGGGQGIGVTEPLPLSSAPPSQLQHPNHQQPQFLLFRSAGAQIPTSQSSPSDSTAAAAAVAGLDRMPVRSGSGQAVSSSDLALGGVHGGAADQHMVDATSGPTGRANSAEDVAGMSSCGRASPATVEALVAGTFLAEPGSRAGASGGRTAETDNLRHLLAPETGAHGSGRQAQTFRSLQLWTTRDSGSGAQASLYPVSVHPRPEPINLLSLSQRSGGGVCRTLTAPAEFQAAAASTDIAGGGGGQQLLKLSPGPGTSTLLGRDCPLLVLGSTMSPTQGRGDPSTELSDGVDPQHRRKASDLMQGVSGGAASATGNGILSLTTPGRRTAPSYGAYPLSLSGVSGGAAGTIRAAGLGPDGVTSSLSAVLGAAGGGGGGAPAGTVAGMGMGSLRVPCVTDAVVVMGLEDADIMDCMGGMDRGGNKGGSSLGM